MSLVELSVASLLLLIVLSLSVLAMRAGVRGFLTVKSETELQQDALVLLSKISREVGEADPAATWPQPTVSQVLQPVGSEPVGIVFSSPRGTDGRMVLDDTTKQPLWHKRICYYYDPSSRQVFRSEDYLTAPSTSPLGQDLTKTTAWFAANSAVKPMPGEVSKFNISVGEDLRSYNFNVEVSNGEGGRVTRVEFLGHATMRG